MSSIIRTRKKRIKGISLLVFLSIIGAFGFLLFKPVSGSSGPELYSIYFEKYPAPETTAATPRWNSFINNYSLANYELALSDLDYIESSIHYTCVEFYKGMCYLLLEDPDFHDARYFMNEVRLDFSDYKEQASWYYGLILLAEDRENDARVVFTQISKDKGYNQKKARAILNAKID